MGDSDAAEADVIVYFLPDSVTTVENEVLRTNNAQTVYWTSNSNGGTPIIDTSVQF